MLSTVTQKNKTTLIPKYSWKSGGWLETARTPLYKGLDSHGFQADILVPSCLSSQFMEKGMPTEQANKQSSDYTNSHGAIYDNTIIICLFTLKFKICSTQP